MPKVKPFIFISYSRKDEVYANKLRNAFEQRGLSVWIDQRLKSGDRWVNIIEQQVRTCQAFVLIVTSSSANSEWVSSELALARKLHKPIFPILLEGEPWWYMTAIQHYAAEEAKLPRALFFESVREHFPAPAPPMPPPSATPTPPPSVIDSTPATKRPSVTAVTDTPPARPRRRSKRTQPPKPTTYATNPKQPPAKGMATHQSAPITYRDQTQLRSAPKPLLLISVILLSFFSSWMISQFNADRAFQSLPPSIESRQ